MNRRNSLIAIFVIAILIAILIPIAAGHGSSKDSPSELSPSAPANAQAAEANEMVETVGRLATEGEAAGRQASAADDGLTLLQTYCAECHSVRLLGKTRMSRSAWDRTLSRMERYSSRMSDSERAVVLDQLAGPDEQ